MQGEPLNAYNLSFTAGNTSSKHWNNYTVTYWSPAYSGLAQSQPAPKEHVPMKGNGKEYLVFKRGASLPSHVADTEAEAVELASELAEAEGVACFVFKAVKKVKPSKRDVTVSDA